MEGGSSMKRILAVTAVSLLLSLWILSESQAQSVKSQVRNPSGKLLYQTKTTGNVTEFRSPTGKLLQKSKTLGNTTEVRSPTGKLLERIQTK
jgi:hypothetical protein